MKKLTLDIARAEVGVAEVPKGSNAGPRVLEYLASVGLKANPWCMAFVYWCVNQACKKLEQKNPLVKTGHVLTQWNKTTLRKLSNRNKNVEPGDIFIMQFSGGRGHTGFVLEVKKGFVVTIEGNTNDDGSREGYEVAIRQRPLSSILGFIKLQ